MKVGRNDLCPSGSGKKYKKCCIGKEKSTIVNDVLDIGAYHNNYLHTKKVKAPRINRKLLNILDNYSKMNIKDIIDDYLEAMNYILDYAKKNNLHTLEELDNEELVADFLINIIGDFEMEVSNLNKDDYDLNITNKYLDKIVTTLKLSDNTYENILRCKTHSLFKLGEYNLGEKVMLDLIEEKNNNSIYPYVQLVDDYEMIGNLEKSKYYYDLGMQQKNLDDLDVLEERKDYFD